MGNERRAGKRDTGWSDPRGEKYIAKYSGFVKAVSAETAVLAPDKRLYVSVLEGNREEIAKAVSAALQAGISPLSAANDIILKALNEVGEKFASKEYFLPQVIRSAETAQVAFAVIKPLLKKDAGFSLGKIVLATVKGDVHDIGKNIVAAVLESHGWEVIDLGKNIEAKDIVDAQKNTAPLLSAYRPYDNNNARDGEGSAGKERTKSQNKDLDRRRTGHREVRQRDRRRRIRQKCCTAAK